MGKRVAWGLQIVGIAFVADTARGEARWPQFRGPNGDGVATTKESLPDRFDPESNLVWKQSVPGGFSSPCVWDDRIFLTAYDEEQKRLETICLNRYDGAVRWRRSAPDDANKKAAANLRQINSPAASTPLTDGERLYVYFDAFGLLCYDVDGTEQWSHPLPTPQTRFGAAASPTRVGDTLVMNVQGMGGYVLALNRRSGKTLWKRDELRFSPEYAMPIVREGDGGTELIVHGNGGLAALNAKDGTERWWLSGLPMQPIPTSVFGDGLLFTVAYFAGGAADDDFALPEFDALIQKHDANEDQLLARDEVPHEQILYHRGEDSGFGNVTFGMMFGMADASGDRDGQVTRDEWTGLIKMATDLMKGENALMAIRPGGAGDVTATSIVWKERRALPEVPSPLYYRGNVYVVKNGGIVSCFDAKTGSLHYRSRLGAGGMYYASPIAGDGKIYAASRNGVIVVFRAGDSLDVLSRNELGESIDATPALTDGRIYVRTEKRVYAFGP